MSEFSAKVTKFKNLVRKAMVLNEEEQEIFKQLPLSYFAKILKANFGNNFAYSERVILDEKRNSLDSVDELRNSHERRKIDNYQFSINTIKQAIQENKPILFLTDTDNDGSISYAMAENWRKTLNLLGLNNEDKFIHFCRSVNGNGVRGISLDLVDEVLAENQIDTTKPFLVITADNGINSHEEQVKINEKYTNATLLITDHHEPDEKFVIVENDNTIVLNPKYEARQFQTVEMREERGNKGKKDEDYEFFQSWNISGASVVGGLLLDVSEELRKDLDVPLSKELEENFLNFTNLSKVANLLDYVQSIPEDKITSQREFKKFLDLQGLMNVNNSMERVIQGKLPNAIGGLPKESNVDVELLKSIHVEVATLNKFAQIMVSLYEFHEGIMQGKIIEDEAEREKVLASFNKEEGFSQRFLEMTNGIDLFDIEKSKNYLKAFGLALKEGGDTNYLGQLRPIIFLLSAKENLNRFQSDLLEQSIDIFKQLRKQEKSLLQEIRKEKIADEIVVGNTSILCLSETLSGGFNRKLLNKAYNGVATPLRITFDNVSENVVSGSFRSTIDIDLILNDNEALEEFKRNEGIDIQVMGHQRAAGIFLTKADGEITQEHLFKFATILSEQIELCLSQDRTKILNDIAEEENVKEVDYLISDIYHLDFFNKLSNITLGGTPHFEQIKPLIKLDETAVVSDANAKIRTAKDVAKEQGVGFVRIKLKFGKKDGDAEINLFAPAGLLNTYFDNNGKDYLQIKQVNDGFFMLDEIVSQEKVEAAQSLFIKHKEENFKLIEDAFGNNLETRKISREELKSLPFFERTGSSEEKFYLQESLMISAIDALGVDVYVCKDVEADGLGRANLINIGTIDYEINSDNASLIPAEEYQRSVFYDVNNHKHFVLNLDDVVPLSKEALVKELAEQNPNVIYKKGENGISAFLYKGESENLVWIRNEKQDEQGNYIVNREIEAFRTAYLVKEKHIKSPVYITYFTGIKNDHLEKYGKSIEEIDNALASRYAGKKIFFTAHNTNYDLGVIQANLPLFYGQIKRDGVIVGDTAKFSKEERLAYSTLNLATFLHVPEIEEGINFNCNLDSSFNLISFLKEGKSGSEFPAIRGGHYLKFDEDGKLHFFKKTDDVYTDLTVSVPIEELTGFARGIEANDVLPEHYELMEKYPDSVNINEISGRLKLSEIKLNEVKYSAQLISDTLLVENMLDNLAKEEGKNLITDFDRYPTLKNHQDVALAFQLAYQFDKTFLENVEQSGFAMSSSIHNLEKANLVKRDGVEINKIQIPEKELFKFKAKFLEKNKTIAQRYSDAWMYKKVLSLCDPQFKDLNSDNFEIISKRTHLPKENVADILQTVYQYKRKQKLQHFYAKEPHANGVEQGDIEFETAATLSLLNQRKAISSVYAVEERLEKATQNFVENAISFSQGLNKERFITNDSFSNIQLLAKEGHQVSDLSKEAIDEMSALESGERAIIDYKLGDILNATTFVSVITKGGVPMSMETIQDHAEDLKFLASVKQLIDNGLSKKNERANYAQIVNENGVEKVAEVINKLSNYYDSIQFNNEKAMGEAVEKLLKNPKDITGRKVQNLEKTLSSGLAVDNDGILTFLGKEALEKFIHRINKMQDNPYFKDDVDNLGLLKETLIQAKEMNRVNPLSHYAETNQVSKIEAEAFNTVEALFNQNKAFLNADVASISRRNVEDTANKYFDKIKLAGLKIHRMVEQQELYQVANMTVGKNVDKKAKKLLTKVTLGKKAEGGQLKLEF